MRTLTPFIFEDNMIRTIIENDQPWFHAADVCRALGIKNPSDAVSKMDWDEVRTLGTNEGTLGTNEGSAGSAPNFVSEAGLYRLIFGSRKPEAERFKRWLAHDVLPKLRRQGSYNMDQQGLQPGFDTIDPKNMDATARMRCVDLASRLHGVAYAKQLYVEVGLPRVIMPVMGGNEEAQDCFEKIMSMEAFGICVLDILLQAMDQDVGPNEPLRHVGILSLPDEDGFVIANRHPEIEKIMKGTRWQHAGWGHVLRRLNGAMPTKAKRFAGGEVSRGTFLPTTTLDLLE